MKSIEMAAIMAKTAALNQKMKKAASNNETKTMAALVMK